MRLYEIWRNIETNLLTKYLYIMRKIYFLFLFVLIASMSGLQAAEKWTLVTSEPESWEGDYLIVYEDKAFDGSLTKLDAVNDYTTVTVSGNEITTDVCDFYFTIEQIDGGYSIKSASGYYIYQTSDGNGLKSSTSTTGSNAITFKSSDDIEIVSGGAHLRFNAASNQMRFRYYKSSTYTDQKPIQLYKKQTAPVTELTAPVITGVVNGETYYGSASVSISYPELATSKTYTITKDGAAGEPVPVTSAVADLVIDEAGTYKIEATAFGEGDAQVEATPVEFTVVGNTEVASVADFLGKVASSENPDEIIYEFTCPLTVAYQYDADIYVRDAEGGALLIYDKSRTYEGKYSMGDVIPAGATGKYDEYNGTYELIEATLGDATETAEIEPVEMAVDAIATTDQSKYVVLKGVTINGNNFVDAESNEIAYYNSFEVEIPTEVASYNVTGIVELFKGNAQIAPIAFEVAEVNKCAAPEFSLAEGTYNETQTLTITSTEGSTIVYTINDEKQTAPSPAEIELPVDGVAVTYTIEAYATMEGAENSEVVTKTYTIDPNAVLPQSLVVKISEVADENGWEASVSNNGTQYKSFTKDNFEFTIDATDANSGKYYSNSDGESWRVYNGASLTISAPASVEITGVEFVTGKWNCSGANTGSLQGKVWTATEEKTSSVTFSMDGSSEILEMHISYKAVPAGVEGVEAADAAIRANADGVVVVAADAVAEVYNAAGQLVATAAVDGESVIAVPAGFYVVRVGNTIAKVVVR